MKPCDVYGAKRAFKLYLIPALALLGASIVFLVLTILWEIQVFYAFVAIAFIGGAYLLYLALYERNLRYKTLCAIEGKDVIATLTHIEQGSGKISAKALAYVEDNGTLIQGELHASFFADFHPNFHDGDQVRVHLLKTKEFLLYEDQTSKSLQNPRQ